MTTYERNGILVIEHTGVFTPDGVLSPCPECDIADCCHLCGRGRCTSHLPHMASGALDDPL